MSNKVVSVTLLARTSAYITQMAGAAKATAGVGTAAAGAAVAAQPMHRSLRNAARATGILNPKLIGPAGLVFGLKSVVGQAKNFEDQFAMVRKTMQEADEVLDQVALNIREIATELPVTTGELNQIATVAGQLGIAADDVSDFTETIAKLSMATNLTAEGAAIDFARLSNIIGKPIDEVEELGNVIVHLGNNMAAQETEIMEFAKRIAGVGTQMGMTEQDILALSAALPALGLRAEMGGTAITRIMVELNKAVTEQGEKLEIFADTAGMSAEAFAAAWREDPANTLLEFTAGIGRMSEEGADAFATISDLDLSMIRTQDTALRLAGGTEVYAEAQRLANYETERQEALQVEVDKRMRTTESQWKILKNNVREYALEVGGPLNTALGATLTLMNDLAAADQGFWGSVREGTFGPQGAVDRVLTMPTGGTGTQPIYDFWARLLGTADDEGTAVAPAKLRDQAAAGKELLAVAEELHIAAMGSQAEQYVDSLLGVDRGQEGHLAAMGAQAEQYVAGLLRVESATRDAANAAKAAEQPWAVLRDEMDRNANSASELSQRFDDLVGTNISAERAAIRVKDGFASLSETLSENEVTLDRNTEAGRRNETAILDQVDAIWGEIESNRRRGDSYGQIMATYDEHIGQLREVMREAGYSESAIDAYIETLGLTPENIRTAIIVDDFGSQTIEDYINRLGRVPRRIVTQLTTQAQIGGSLSGDQSGLRGHTGGYIHPDGSIQRFHGGGMVGGLASDEVPAILQTGEMILNRQQVAQIGAAFSSARERLAPSRGHDGAATPGLNVTQVFNSDADRHTLAEARHQQRLAYLEAF